MLRINLSACRVSIKGRKWEVSTISFSFSVFALWRIKAVNPGGLGGKPPREALKKLFFLPKLIWQVVKL